MLNAESSRPPIGAGLTVRDVLTRYPATGPIFLQHGPMFTVRPGELHPTVRIDNRSSKSRRRRRS
jgi:hypothetical protein